MPLLRVIQKTFTISKTIYVIDRRNHYSRRSHLRVQSLKRLLERLLFDEMANSLNVKQLSLFRDFHVLKPANPSFRHYNKIFSVIRTVLWIANKIPLSQVSRDSLFQSFIFNILATSFWRATFISESISQTRLKVISRQKSRIYKSALGTHRSNDIIRYDVAELSIFKLRRDGIQSKRWIYTVVSQKL